MGEEVELLNEALDGQVHLVAARAIDPVIDQDRRAIRPTAIRQPGKSLLHGDSAAHQLTMVRLTPAGPVTCSAECASSTSSTVWAQAAPSDRSQRCLLTSP